MWRREREVLVLELLDVGGGFGWCFEWCLEGEGRECVYVYWRCVVERVLLLLCVVVLCRDLERGYEGGRGVVWSSWVEAKQFRNEKMLDDGILCFLVVEFSYCVFCILLFLVRRVWRVFLLRVGGRYGPAPRVCAYVLMCMCVLCYRKRNEQSKKTECANL